MQAKGKVEQAWLLVTDQSGQGNRGTHIAERIVCLLVQQAIGARQVFQLEAGRAILLGRPDYALGPQRIDHAHHIEQIPAAAAVLPFARIGIGEIAPEHETRDLVIEAYGVIAHAHGAGLGQFGFDAGRELDLGNALFQRPLRRDARDQAGLRIGQIVVGRLAVPHHGLADFVELVIRAYARKLRGTVVARLGAKGFVVVPEEGMSHGPEVCLRTGTAYGLRPINFKPFGPLALMGKAQAAINVIV